MDFISNDELTAEAKKDNLYAYLSECGITSKLNEIFGKMLQASVKPENPLDFIREELGEKLISAEEMEKMEQDLDDALREIQRLRNILKKLGIENVDTQYENLEVGPDEFESVGADMSGMSLNSTSPTMEEP